MGISPIIFVLVVLSAALAFEAAVAMLRSRGAVDQARSRRRLRTLASSLQAEDSQADVSLLRGDRVERSSLDHWIAQLPFASKVSLTLYRAGMTLPLKRFLAISVVFGILGLIAAAAFLPVPGSELIGLGAGFLPYLRALRMAAKRTAAFEAQFSDALDLLIRALRAGHSFSVGLQMVGEELPDPVGCEFALMADEIQLGKEVRAALANLAHRINAPDLPFFVVAVTMQQETGSNLAEVLHNLSSLIRERFKLYGKVRSLTAMGRGTANMLAIWPGVMVGALYLTNKDYIRPLWETDSGHTMMMISAVMISIGYLMCRKMATIEV